jgi:microcystin-dependent protein
MTQPFLGQIQPFGFGFAPRGWALCNGQILSISQNTALFSLLGTMYGGNGQTTFALPNLQSRVPMHKGNFVGTDYLQGEEAGEEAIGIDIGHMPLHNHTFSGTTDAANNVSPADGAALAQVHHQGGTTPDFYFAPDTTPQPLNIGSLATFGGNQPHTNLQPYLTVSWCIAMQGIFPSRN